MADHDLGAVAVGALGQGQSFLLVQSKGLFQQHVVARIQKRQAGLYVEPIQGAVDDDVGQLSAGGQLVGTAEAHILGEAVPLPRHLTADGIGVSHTHYAEQIGVAEGNVGVSDGAMARSHDDGGNRCWLHDIVSCYGLGFRGQIPKNSLTLP